MKILFSAFAFLLLCNEVLKNHNTEKSIKEKTKKFLNHGGKELFMKIKGNNMPKPLSDFIMKSQKTAENKHNSSTFSSLASIALCLYMLSGKFSQSTKNP